MLSHNIYHRVTNITYTDSKASTHFYSNRYGLRTTTYTHSTFTLPPVQINYISIEKTFDLRRTSNYAEDYMLAA